MDWQYQRGSAILTSLLEYGIVRGELLRGSGGSSRFDSVFDRFTDQTEVPGK